MPGAVALRLDDVGASSKRFEVYGRTRLPFGGWQLPFPGNFLFLMLHTENGPRRCLARAPGSR
jgi:hypothetical protein